MRRIAAYIFAGLFVVLMPLTLFARQAETRLFSPQAYKTMLKNSGFYETMPAVMGAMLHDSLSVAEACGENPVMCAEEGLLPPEVATCMKEALPSADYAELADQQRPPAPQEMDALETCVQRYGFDYRQLDNDPLAQFSAQDWADFLSATTPPEAWQRAFETSVDSFFSLLDGQTTQVILPLETLRRSLTGEQAVDALLSLLESKPACTPAETIRWQRYINGESDEAPDLCQLPIILYPQVKPILHEYLQEYAHSLPETLVLLDVPPEAELPEHIRSLRFLMRAAPALPLLFLAIASVLAIASPRDWLRWWGIPGLLSGLLGLLLSNFILLRLNQALMTLSTDAGQIDLPPDLINGLVNAGLGVSQGLSGTLTRTSLTLGAIGGLLLAAAYFVKDSPPKTAA